MTFSRVYPFLRPFLPQMAVSALFTMGVAVLNLTLIRIAGQLWDVITVDRSLAALTTTIWILVGLVSIHALLTMGHSYLTARVSQQIMANFRSHLFSHIQRLSLRFFSTHRTGEILSRIMNDVGVIHTLMTETPLDFAKHLVTAIGGIGFLLYMNWRLCVLILVFLPLLAIVARIFGRQLKALSTRIQDHTATLTTILEEVISGIRIVKSFVQEKREHQRVEAAIQALLTTVLRRARILAAFIPVITVSTFLMALAVLWYGGKHVVEGHMSPGDLFAFVLFAGILIGPFGSVARIFAQLKEAQGAMARVFELLDTQPEIRDAPDAIELPPVAGQVQFSHVSFAYDPRHPILTDLSFEIRAGERVALVGPTGSGKTTVVNLLHRFYDPQSGRITLDGIDLRRVTIESLYRQIALVPQDTLLFGGTILDNIRYGRADASDEDILRASREAHAHEFIEQLPDGYRTIVGEKGVNLSGGQRQRIAIARALLKNPRILLLDEATSALDAETELLVQSALNRLMAGRTTVIIAHRFSTIQSVNRILVLHHGRIVEEGSHAELMERCGLYHHLYTLKMAEAEGMDQPLSR